MKRLTIRNSDGSVSQPVDMKWSEALERLAAYEDMELEPEELHELLHDSTGPLHRKLGEWIGAERDGRLLIMDGGIKDMCWISTADMLPDVGDPVLIVRKINQSEPVRVEPAVLRPNGTWKAIGHKFQQTNVSHWMPMPIPPQEGEI